MNSFLNLILNTLIRDLSKQVRVTLSIVMFLCAVFCFMNSIRKKDDKNPLSVGWLFLSLLFLFISALYMFL